MLRGRVGNHLKGRVPREFEVEQALQAISAQIKLDEPFVLSLRKSYRGFIYIRCKGISNGKGWVVDIYARDFFRIEIEGLSSLTSSGVLSMIGALRAGLTCAQ